MEPVECIGVRIRAARKRRGLTQEQLAGRVGRTVNALSALERGKNLPPLDTLRGLAEALDVPMRDFFAPAGGEAESPEHAALHGELFDAARALPLDDLELAAGIVGLMARRRGGGAA